MIITLTIVGFLIIILFIGKINYLSNLNKKVKELFSQSKNISGKTFNYEQIAGLPEPVQRYFKHVLKEGQPYISYGRITHDGQFRTGLDKKWVNIKGGQYFTTEKPGLYGKAQPPCLLPVICMFLTWANVLFRFFLFLMW